MNNKNLSYHSTLKRFIDVLSSSIQLNNQQLTSIHRNNLFDSETPIEHTQLVAHKDTMTFVFDDDDDDAYEDEMSVYSGIMSAKLNTVLPHDATSIPTPT